MFTFVSLRDVVFQVDFAQKVKEGSSFFAPRNPKSLLNFKHDVLDLFSGRFSSLLLHFAALAVNRIYEFLKKHLHFSRHSGVKKSLMAL